MYNTLCTVCMAPMGVDDTCRARRGKNIVCLCTTVSSSVREYSTLSDTYNESFIMNYKL